MCFQYSATHIISFQIYAVASLEIAKLIWFRNIYNIIFLQCFVWITAKLNRSCLQDLKKQTIFSSFHTGWYYIPVLRRYKWRLICDEYGSWQEYFLNQRVSPTSWQLGCQVTTLSVVELISKRVLTITCIY